MASNLNRPGDNGTTGGNHYPPGLLVGVYNTYETHMWMLFSDYLAMVQSLQSVKFTVQAERDRVPNIISSYAVDPPFDVEYRFRHGRWIAIKDGQQYLQRMVQASYFKNRADEVNRGRGQLPSTSTLPDSEKLQEDFQAPQDLRDAQTQFSKALSTFLILNKTWFYTVTFELATHMTWLLGGAAGTTTGATTPP